MGGGEKECECERTSEARSEVEKRKERGGVVFSPVRFRRAFSAGPVCTVALAYVDALGVGAGSTGEEGRWEAGRVGMGMRERAGGWAEFGVGFGSVVAGHGAGRIVCGWRSDIFID